MRKLNPQDKLDAIRKLVTEQPMAKLYGPLIAVLDAPQPKPKARSRPDRWAEACGDAQDALERLTDIQGEFQEWRDNLPENLESSALAEKLDGVIELDIEGAKGTVDEAAEIDLPRGFGRD